ncbi:MAG: hypothetical protein Q7R95_05610, partial [bacterium]|nr:hypothetical protein [bacterium]
LLVRTPVVTHLDFNPYGETIPRLFDEYDRCMNAYFDKLENKLPTGKQGEVMEDFARIASLSQVNDLPKERLFIPRFRTVINLLKNNSDVIKNFESQKKEVLTDEEKTILEERIQFVKIYLEKYAQEEQISTNQQKPFVLNENQKKFLQSLIEKLKILNNPTKEEIQIVILSILKENSFKPKEVFQGFYQALIGKDFGPKAADLIISLSLSKTIELLKKNIH